MTVYRWTFEGQTSGVGVTSGNATTFGDPAYGAVSIGGTCAYSSAQAAFGTRSIVNTATVGQANVLRSQAVTATTTLAYQAYYYVTAYPSADIALARWVNTTTAGQFHAQMDTSGRIYLLDNTGSSPATLLRLTAVPLNTWYRYDAYAVVGSANNNSTFKHRLIRLSDAVQVDEQVSTAVNLNNAAASPALLVSGQHGKPTSGGAITNLYIDNPAWQDGGANYITPASTALTVTGAMVPDSGNAPLAVTLTLSHSGGTGTTVTDVVTWGDGSSNSSTTTGVATHTYNSAGTYTWSVSSTNA